jgi:hypothetical protein
MIGASMRTAKVNYTPQRVVAIKIAMALSVMRWHGAAKQEELI